MSIIPDTIDVPQRIRDMADQCAGARVTYEGNIIRCARHRTFAENLTAALAALEHVTGVNFDDIPVDMSVEMYRSYGYATEV